MSLISLQKSIYESKQKKIQRLYFISLFQDNPQLSCLVMIDDQDLNGVNFLIRNGFNKKIYAINRDGFMYSGILSDNVHLFVGEACEFDFNSIKEKFVVWLDFDGSLNNNNNKLAINNAVKAKYIRKLNVISSVRGCSIIKTNSIFRMLLHWHSYNNYISHSNKKTYSKNKYGGNMLSLSAKFFRKN